MNAAQWNIVRWVIIGLMILLFLGLIGPMAAQFIGGRYRDARMAWTWSKPSEKDDEVAKLREELNEVKQEAAAPKDEVSSEVMDTEAAAPPLPPTPDQPAEALAPVGPGAPAAQGTTSPAPALPPAVQALTLDEDTNPAVQVKALTVMQDSPYDEPVIAAWLDNNRVIKIGRLRMITTMRPAWQAPQGWFIPTGTNKGLLVVEVTKLCDQEDRAGMVFYNASRSSSVWWSASHARANKEVFAPLWYERATPVDPSAMSGTGFKGGTRFKEVEARGL